MNQEKHDKFLRDWQVGDITKLSKSTRWRLERGGNFPKRRKLSANVVAWLESEVMEWLRSRATL